MNLTNHPNPTILFIEQDRRSDTFFNQNGDRFWALLRASGIFPDFDGTNDLFAEFINYTYHVNFYWMLPDNHLLMQEHTVNQNPETQIAIDIIINTAPLLVVVVGSRAARSLFGLGFSVTGVERQIKTENQNIITVLTIPSTRFRNYYTTDQQLQGYFTQIRTIIERENILQ